MTRHLMAGGQTPHSVFWGCSLASTSASSWGKSWRSMAGDTLTGAWLPHLARSAFVSRELGGDQRVLGHGHRAGPRPRAFAFPLVELKAVALVSVPGGHLDRCPRTGGQGAVRDHRRRRDVGREAQIRRAFSYAGQSERLERCGIRKGFRVPARGHRGLVIAH